MTDDVAADPGATPRHHHARATVQLRQYPDATLALFYGTCCLARYGADGTVIEAEVADAA